MANSKTKTENVKNPNNKENSFLNTAKTFALELFYLIKSIGLGVFTLFDFIINFFVSFTGHFVKITKKMYEILKKIGLAVVLNEILLYFSNT